MQHHSSKRKWNEEFVTDQPADDYPSDYEEETKQQMDDSKKSDVVDASSSSASSSAAAATEAAVVVAVVADNPKGPLSPQDLAVAYAKRKAAILATTPQGQWTTIVLDTIVDMPIVLVDLVYSYTREPITIAFIERTYRNAVSDQANCAERVRSARAVYHRVDTNIRHIEQTLQKLSNDSSKKEFELVYSNLLTRGLELRSKVAVCVKEYKAHEEQIDRLGGFRRICAYTRLPREAFDMVARCYDGFPSAFPTVELGRAYGIEIHADIPGDDGEVGFFHVPFRNDRDLPNIGRLTPLAIDEGVAYEAVRPTTRERIRKYFKTDVYPSGDVDQLLLRYYTDSTTTRAVAFEVWQRLIVSGHSWSQSLVLLALLEYSSSADEELFGVSDRFVDTWRTTVTEREWRHRFESYQRYMGLFENAVQTKAALLSAAPTPVSGKSTAAAAAAAENAEDPIDAQALWPLGVVDAEGLRWDRPHKRARAF